MTIRASQGVVKVLVQGTDVRPRVAQAVVKVLAFDTTPPPSRVTQIPVLLVHLPIQSVRATQVPALLVHLPIQSTRVTQIPVLQVSTPTPIPLPLPVVPEVPVKEVWQWKTVVNIMEGSREQRSALRGHPRMSQSFPAFILNEDYEYRDIYNLMLKYISKLFNYPMYVYHAKMDAAAVAGATKLFFNPAHTDLRDGEVAALYDKSLETTTFVTVLTVDVDGATLAEPLEADVPAYAFISPAPQFRIELPRLSMESVSGSFQLDLIGAQVRDVLRPDQSTTVTTVDGFMVLDARPLVDGGVPEGFNQDITWLDNDIANPEPRTSWFAPFTSSERSYLIHRENGFDIWRARAAYFKGRQNPFLLPTYRNDLPVIETPALSATEFKTDSIQFFDVWRSRAWRYIQIMSDAGTIYRKINEVTANYDLSGQPVSLNVKISGNIGAAAGSNSNMIVSFANTCRLDSDEIVLDHYEADTVLSIKVRTIDE